MPDFVVTITDQSLLDAITWTRERARPDLPDDATFMLVHMTGIAMQWAAAKMQIEVTGAIEAQQRGDPAPLAAILAKAQEMAPAEPAPLAEPPATQGAANASA